MAFRDWLKDPAAMVRAMVATVAVAVAALPASPALAQPMRGMFGGGNQFDPDVNTKEIERYAEFLKLTPDQLQIANELLSGYQAEFNALADDMRRKQDAAREEFRETRDPGVWRDLRPAFEEYQKRRTAAADKFMEDLRLVLTPEQEAKWPGLLQERRRERTLPRGGLMSGETVDVVRLVRDEKYPDELNSSLQPVLDQYAAELDRVLAERNKIYEDGMSQGMDMFNQGRLQEMEDLFAKARDAAKKVRDVNRRYARQIEALLPEDQRAAFAAEFRKRSFPDVFRDRAADREFRTALALPDLSDDQRTQLTQLQESYARESAINNDKMVEAVEKGESTRSIMQMFGAGGAGSDEIRALRTARRELDNRTSEKLRAVLSDDQRAKLPERGADRGPGGPGGGGPGRRDRGV
ncbi:MAG: hypothetical protein IBJ11_05090 [Phycisphaerales bacterium]|nr:hypothetical protein [Phycisphaerales bacterium]